MNEINTITPKTEIETVLTSAQNICVKYDLPQVCTEALLLAITDNVTLTGYNHLQGLGVNVTALKKSLQKSLQNKASHEPHKNIILSIALEGVIFLNGGNTSSLNLLKTIVKYNNTAAARLLRSQGLFLNNTDQLIFKN